MINLQAKRYHSCTCMCKWNWNKQKTIEIQAAILRSLYVLKCGNLPASAILLFISESTNVRELETN